ncbi:hypothetical protein SAMN04490243_0914 [Robiginitalea myxolifaciens]|uniref:Uncharacterized protein n=1 Tax=Robiginitalea myxolifaciens TaxID=400055 RepID=A0A1I6FYG9_9FLAO|nr:hypothetical protein [Robiginitalea myxolifaciens]SFR34956.1 hypothetical protein SAMN04490243_0914 [Robiginitalea myxolifaciens]
MTNRLKQLLFIGVFIELLLFAILLLSSDTLPDAFRLTARYTGRISFGLYVVMFYHFINEKFSGQALEKTYTWGMLFCVLHLIHFGFLSASVYSNELPIIPHKLIGGAVAYLAIVSYPFYMKRIKRLGIHLAYFYYVGIVMGVTFLARIRGEFEGAPESPFHYFGIATLAVLFIYSFKVFLNKNNPEK